MELHSDRAHSYYHLTPIKLGTRLRIMLLLGARRSSSAAVRRRLRALAACVLVVVFAVVPFSAVGASSSSSSMAAADVRARLEADGSFDRIEVGLKAIDTASAHRAPAERDAQRTAFLRRQLDLAVARLSTPSSSVAEHMGNGRAAPRSTLLLQQQQQQQHRQQQQNRGAAAVRQNHRQRQLLMNDDDAAEDEENVGMAMTEPTPECRRILNTWTSKCVFTDKTAK